LFYCSDCWKHWAPLKNSDISGARCAEDLLIIVGGNLSALNEMNLRTAVHRLGTMARRRDFPQIATDNRFRGLLDRICETQLSGRSVANVIYGLAKMKKMRRLATGAEELSAVLNHLEGATRHVAPEMVSQEVANTVWAYATLGKAPGEKAWKVLEAAAVRVGPEMVPQAVSNTVWAYATLGKAPG
jgi:hypothetical protein